MVHNYKEPTCPPAHDMKHTYINLNVEILFLDDICSILDEGGLKHTVILSRKAHNEKLTVLKFHRQ